MQEVDKARVTRMQERASKIVELKKSALLDPITQQYQYVIIVTMTELGNK